jgi:hypothetical protein
MHNALTEVGTAGLGDDLALGRYTIVHARTSQTHRVNVCDDSLSMNSGTSVLPPLGSSTPLSASTALGVCDAWFGSRPPGGALR